MKIAVVVFAILGAALAASIEENEIPEFKNIYVEPIKTEDDSTPQLTIINGREVAPHSIPYQAYLSMSDGVNRWSCGGSLLTKTFILTAAHCIDGARFVQVTLGAHNLAQPALGSKVVNGKRWVIHENYDDRTVDNDIGVIELERAVTLSNTIQLTRLPSLRDVGINLVGENARVSGWGLTNGIFETTTTVLLEVNNTIINNRECNDVYGIVRDEEICLSSAGGRSACRGDSGGPLVIGNVQQGIVSYGTRFCLSSSPSVYVRITSFLNWIQTHSNWRSS